MVRNDSKDSLWAIFGLVGPGLTSFLLVYLWLRISVSCGWKSKAWARRSRGVDVWDRGWGEESRKGMIVDVCLQWCYLDTRVHAQPCLTLCNSRNCCYQALLFMESSRQEYRSGEQFPHPGDFPKGRDQTQVSCVSCIGRQILYHWATWEAPILGHECLNTERMTVSWKKESR